MSFDIALSGLNAAQSKLDVIANNIANSDTNGFKRSRVGFADVYAASQNGIARNATGKGVRVAGVSTEHSQGDIKFTENNMDLAISGLGFFRLSDQGSVVYSRAGSFQVDRDGYIQNTAGQRLTGYQANAQGDLIGTQGDLHVDFADAVPQATTSIDLGANLDAEEEVPAVAFDVNEPASFNHSTSTTVYDSLGVGHTSTMYYRKSADNTWESRLYVDAAEVSNPGGDILVFDDQGALVTINGAPGTQITSTSYDPGNGAANMTISMDVADLTQFGDSFGINALSQDGYPTGRLTSIDVDQTGVIFARYSNGRSGILGQVSLTNFASVEGLQPDGDTSFKETFASGAPLTAEPGSTNLGLIQSGALEQANVEITKELVNMIQAQRTFQANAQVISTAEEVTQTVINIGR